MKVWPVVQATGQISMSLQLSTFCKHRTGPVPPIWTD